MILRGTPEKIASVSRRFSRKMREYVGKFGRLVRINCTSSEHRQELRHGGAQHVFLAAEVFVEGRARNSRLGNDSLNGDTLEAAAKKQIDEGAKDCGTRALATAFDEGNHTRERRTNGRGCPPGPQLVE